MTDIAEPQALDIGRVVQETFQVLGRHFITFFVLALILVGIPSAVFHLFQAATLRSAASTMNFAFSGGAFYWGLLGGLVALATSCILQATIISGAASDLNGRPVSVADCLRIGLRAFLPLIGLSILLGIAIGFGLILLVVPGVILALMWCVAVPAYVVEQPALFDAFGRSADLTRGNRLRILALGVLWVVAAIIISIVIGMVGGILGFVSGGLYLYVSAAIVQPLIAAISGAVGATLSAVLYIELRRIREGAGPQALAGIFD
jgi:hypothetical protein